MKPSGESLRIDLSDAAERQAGGPAEAVQSDVGLETAAFTGPIAIQLRDDPQQATVLTHRAGELRVLGAAGTGKTTLLAHLAAQIGAEAGPDRVLGLTSTRGTAREMQADVLEAGPVALAPQVTTAHGLALEVVGRAGLDTHESLLLTAPEQETRIRELLQGGSDVGWPAEWKLALGTRTFTRQVRRAVARLRGLGLAPATVRAWAQAQHHQGWLALANFTEEYLDVLAWEGVTDYQELLLSASRALSGTALADQTWDVVLVDDAQELDHLQWRFLAELGRRTKAIVIAGDPNQAIMGFRGSAPELLTDAGTPLVPVLSGGGPGRQTARTVVLEHTYRGSAPYRETSAAMMQTQSVPGLPASAHAPLLTPVRALEQEQEQEQESSLACQHFESETAQAAHLAQRLVAAHRSGTPWRDMAVLLRSSRSEAPVVLRALREASIPVQTVITDTPLADEPAVATLLRCANIAAAGLADLADADAELLLTSPLIAVEPEACRRLTGWLAADGASSLAQAVRDPAGLADAPKALRQTVQRLLWLGELLQSGHRLVVQERTPAEVLWHFWAGGQHRPGQDSWPDKLQAAALGSGPTSVVAHRELDAVVALFRLAERAPTRWGGHRGLAAFIEEIQTQDIGAEPDLQTETSQASVLVTSVYRARGRQWPLVAIPNISDAQWTAPQVSAGLIRPEDLTPVGLSLLPPVRGPEDRRLLNFAISRASDALWLASHGADGPSVVLQRAGLTFTEVVGFPAAAPTQWQLLHELRGGALSDSAQVRAQAISELHRLAQESADAEPRAFPAANPMAWPGAREWTHSTEPLRPLDEHVQLSPSALSSLSQCQLRWFLERQVKAGPSDNPAAVFGTVIHAAISDLITAAQQGEPVGASKALDRYWAACEHDSQWHADLERGRALSAVERAAGWISERPGRLLSEHAFEAQVPVVLANWSQRSGDGSPSPADAIPTETTDGIRLTGAIDALEVDPAGQGTIWDFKTQGQKTPRAEVAEHLQLQAYQLALQSGDPEAGVDSVQGAGLVHVCVPQGAKNPQRPAQGMQEALTAAGDSHIREQMARSVVSIRTEEFNAEPGKWCRTCVFVDMCPAQRQQKG